MHDGMMPRRMATIREQIDQILTAFPAGAEGIDLILSLAAVCHALDMLQRDLARERLSALERRFRTKHTALSARDRRELVTIVAILRPWEQGGTSLHRREAA